MWLLFILVAVVAEPQPGYGYIGPACAVVDGTLFIHGVARRILSREEAEGFRNYQRQLSFFTLGSFEQMDAPLVPTFCNGLDDSVEVVLSSCIVRNNHVYEGDRLVRPLSNREKQRLATAISRRSRSRRSSGMTKQRDISALIHRFLNVNSSVTSRFLPVVSQSPLFNMDGGWESVLGKEDTQMTTTSATATTTEKARATFRPHSKATRRRFTTKSMYTTLPTTTSSTTIKTITLTPTYIKKSATTSVIPSVATVNVPSHFPSSEVEETVRDPILLQLIAQALEKNHLLDNLLLPPSGHTSVPFHAQPPPEKSSLILQLVPPIVDGPVSNLPFTPHLSFTSLGGNEVFPNRRRKPVNKLTDLPDDIC